MINQIRQERKLNNCLRTEIEDAGIKIAVDERLTERDYVGIKVDDYYRELKLAGETPKAVDYIVTVDCSCDAYALYIMEFKHLKSTNGIVTKDIEDKFVTTIDDFMKERFSYIFENDKYKYKDIKLYLVTSAYKNAMQYGTFEKYMEILKKVNARDTLQLDTRLSNKVYIFRNRRLYISREIPPNPVIRKIVD